MVEPKHRQGGARRLDHSTQAWLEKAQANPGALTAKQKRDRERVRVKYDFPPALKVALERIALREGTSASQAAAILLAHIVVRYAGGERLVQEAFAHKSPANTPRFDYNVELDPAWARLLEAFAANGAVGGDIERGR